MILECGVEPRWRCHRDYPLHRLTPESDRCPGAAYWRCWSTLAGDEVFLECRSDSHTGVQHLIHRKLIQQFAELHQPSVNNLLCNARCDAIFSGWMVLCGRQLGCIQLPCETMIRHNITYIAQFSNKCSQ
eukprot:3643812-Amphidinium_carterae.3